MKFTKKLGERIQGYIEILQKYVDRIWYPPLIGVFAALDNILVIIPNDGILISSSMLNPRRWFSFALSVSIGSTIGAILLAAFVETQGLEWILKLYPGIDASQTWVWTENFFDKYGLILVFVVAITPVMQQPAIILASLAETPLLLLASIVFTGRFIKFLLMAYLGSHAPRLLSKMWGLQGELKDVGIKIK